MCAQFGRRMAMSKPISTQELANVLCANPSLALILT